jgi:hypothetical protein
MATMRSRITVTASHASATIAVQLSPQDVERQGFRATRHHVFSTDTFLSVGTVTDSSAGSTS